MAARGWLQRPDGQIAFAAGVEVLAKRIQAGESSEIQEWKARYLIGCRAKIGEKTEEILNSAFFEIRSVRVSR